MGEHYSQLTPEKYHAEFIVSEKICGMCAFGKKEIFMTAALAKKKDQNDDGDVWQMGRVIVHWCLLPASRNFGTMVAAFGTCDHFQRDQKDVDSKESEGDSVGSDHP